MLQLMMTGAALALLVGASPAPDAGDVYVPEEPVEPSLNVTAFAECVTDAPWISYDVTLVDPDDRSTSHDVSLVFTEGGRRLEVPLGPLGDDNRLAGRILWPGATVDAAGAGSDWPGWVQQGGEWVDVGDDDLGWTRDGATASIEVNPEAAIAVAYPPATPRCVAGPRPTADEPPVSAAPTALAATGPEIIAPLMLGATLLMGGLAFAAARRRPRE
ncbi:cell wall protein [Microbacterium rhizophilus]|uniref:cell wall protein n=1 Tax=Microbacterium rhizophilus TaxID=3138934 RepID=UPI0031EAAA25